jgi:hypothetical protein
MQNWTSCPAKYPLSGWDGLHNNISSFKFKIELQNRSFTFVGIIFLLNTFEHPMAQQNFGQYFRALLIVFAALLAGQVFLVGILYFTMTPATIPGGETGDPMQYIVPIAVLAFLGFGFFLSKQRIETARQKDGLVEKLDLYRSAKIVQWAMVEGSTLITIVLYFFASGRPEFLGLSAICILYFVTLRPSQEKIVHELALTSAEQMRLKNPDELVG